MRHVVKGRARYATAMVFAVALALPGVASADAPRRVSEHDVWMDCLLGESILIVRAGSESNEALLDSAEWFGVTSDVTVSEIGGGATIDARIPITDSQGEPAGEAVLHAILTATGDEFVQEPSFREGNSWTKTKRVTSFMLVSGTLDNPDGTVDLGTGDCFAFIRDLEVFETRPHASVSNESELFVGCRWETAESSAHLEALSDSFGTVILVFLTVGDDHMLSGSDGDVALTSSGLSATVPLFDLITGLAESATVNATLEASGDRVEWVLVGQHAKTTNAEQRLAPSGELTFSTGQSFTLDETACIASNFESRTVLTEPYGPQPSGPAPINDTAAGALIVEPGDHATQQTKGTATLPEMQATTCPDGEFAALGHTVWYAFTGTGGHVTIDTAGSNFDTVVAVYDGSLVELACEDDMALEPFGLTLQASLMLDTVEGGTYYVQAGGFDPVGLTGVSNPEFGGLRVSFTG